MLMLPNASINYYPSRHSQHLQEIPWARVAYPPSAAQEYKESHEKEEQM